jgi:two-component sensor histidine kinase
MSFEPWHQFFWKYQRYFGIIFILFFLAFTLVTTTYIYETARNEVIDQTRNELMTTAEGISTTIRGEDLVTLQPGDESAPEYLRIRDQIRKFQSVGDIRFVYLMKQQNGTVTFLVDADSGYDPSAAKTGEVYANPTASLMEGFSRPSADREFYTDRWGSFLSGYAPVYTTSGEPVALVGVDMDETKIRSKMDFLDTTRLLLALFIVIISGVGAIFMDRSHMVNEDALSREIELRRESERILQESLTEKTVMLREIHHRVNNNLQILISLIKMQSRAETNPRAVDALRGCQTRVVALAVVHELLYVSKNVSSIDAQQYLDRLGSTLIQFYRRDRPVATLQVNAPRLSLDLSTAIPLGLIMNELISNSIRHAFTEEKPGTIVITVTETDNTVTIRYQDDGCGLPEGFDWMASETLGFRLIASLVGQLDGKVELQPGPGVAFLIIIPGKASRDN